MATEPMPIPAPVVEPAAKISPFGRIIGVLFSPKSTFEDIARKPSWILPVGDFDDLGNCQPQCPSISG